jgi:hypothetical protein
LVLESVGISEGVKSVKRNSKIKTAFGTPARYESFLQHFDHTLSNFNENHLLNTYIFCTSLHDVENCDGQLSMWRGYASNGSGVAIVFDTSKIKHVDTSALMLSEVIYKTRDARIAWADQLSTSFAEIIEKENIPDQDLAHASWFLFERLKLDALLSKHSGFKEEREWRFVYMPWRDQEKKLAHMFSYFNGSRGVEPKLKFKVEPKEGMTADDLSLEKIVHSIILGPTVDKTIGRDSVVRMLENHGKSRLCDRLSASSIPFREV